MISYISQSETVYCLYNSENERRSANKYIAHWNAVRVSGPKIINLVWIPISHSDFWLRDYLLFGKNETGVTNIVSFAFNEWGYSTVSDSFNQANLKDSKIAQSVGSYLNKNVVYSDVTMEGGGLEFNSDINYGNRLIVSEAVILQKQRTDNSVLKTICQINDGLLRIFNLDDIIYLPQFRFDGTQEYTVPQCSPLNTSEYCTNPNSPYYLPSGGGLVADESTFNGPQLNPITDNSYVSCPITTNGHTDEYVKWYGPNHVLLAYVPGVYAPETMEGRTQYRLNVIRDILISKGINIKLVPSAPEIVLNVSTWSDTYSAFIDMVYVTNGAYWNISSLVDQPIMSIYPENKPVPIVSARSYMNAVVTNSHVLVPKYGDPRDQEAYQAFYEAFQKPGNPSGRSRIVVQIKDLDSINAGGGGMHCITQNQPL